MKNTITTSLSCPENNRGFPERAHWHRLSGRSGISRTLALRETRTSRRAWFGLFAHRGRDSFLGKILGGPGKTSIRAGFGIFYAAIQGETLGLISDNAPYGFTYTSPAPPLFTTPFVDAATGNVEGQRFPAQFAPLNVSTEQSRSKSSTSPNSSRSAQRRAISPPTRFPTPSRTCYPCSGKLETAL